MVREEVLKKTKNTAKFESPTFMLLGEWAPTLGPLVATQTVSLGSFWIPLEVDSVVFHADMRSKTFRSDMKWLLSEF